MRRRSFPSENIIFPPRVFCIFIALLKRADVTKSPVTADATVIARIIPKFFPASMPRVNRAIKFAGTSLSVTFMIAVIVFSEKKNFISPVDIRVRIKSRTFA